MRRKFVSFVLLTLPLFTSGKSGACTIGQFAELLVGEVNYSGDSAEFSTCRIGFAKDIFGVTTDLYVRGIRITRSQIFRAPTPDMGPAQVERILKAGSLSLSLQYTVELPALSSPDYWERTITPPHRLNVKEKSKLAPFVVTAGDGTEGHRWRAELASSNDGKVMKLKRDPGAQRMVHWVLKTCGISLVEERAK